MRSVLKIAVVSRHRCQLGEGPVWDADRQTICWIDILRGDIHQYIPLKDSYTKLAVPQFIGSIALCENGSFIAALKDGICLIDKQTGRMNLLSSPEDHLPNNRFNDGKCDPAGRFWVGSMSLWDDQNKGSVYVIGEELKVECKITPVSISNGMAWSPDEKTMYYIDTPTFEVVAYAYDRHTGVIGDRKVAVKIPEKEGYPDGMTIDSEGMLWIAHWDGWQIARWDPVTGKQIFSIPLPVAQVTSCTFGGADLGDLYVTSARTGLTAAEIKKQPLAGALFVIRNSGFKGLPSVEFKF